MQFEATVKEEFDVRIDENISDFIGIEVHQNENEATFFQKSTSKNYWMNLRCLTQM